MIDFQEMSVLSVTVGSAFLCIILGSVDAADSAHKYTKHQGKKLTGSLLATHPHVTSARHCSMYCRATTGCTAYNVINNTHSTECQLLGEDQNTHVDDPDVDCYGKKQTSRM